MSDVIHLLSDNIANQIAAGEVIQRPSSAAKELLENAVDAGATEIKLIVADAGKSLVQVIDNGKGMSETDARMCFERHATSKIRKIDDLFSITTMGFRGEALASIAAVAQVELKSRRAEDELGTYIALENSVVTTQEPCSFTQGTSISMKNLFFNVPARRNFLKNNAIEMRHIIDEFIRVAMAFPHVFFSLTGNGDEMFHFEAGNAKQRVLQILGSNMSGKIVSVKENTDYMHISGFVGKPEAARKTRGDQYFFVNNRFIKSAYLNHAVSNAFADLLPKDSFPLYTLFIELDPTEIDINVHPTKQEIKFEDEKIIYAFVQAAVKHSLAQFSVAPSLDFTLNAGIQQLDAVNKPFTEDEKRTASESRIFQSFTQKGQTHKIDSTEKSELKHWKDFFTSSNPDSSNQQPQESIVSRQFEYETSSQTQQSLPYESAPKNSLNVLKEAVLLQLHNTYIIAPTQSGFILVHQQLAHERVLYEQFSTAVYNQKTAVQKLLFPITLEISASDAVLLSELLPDLLNIGYEIESFGKDSFIIQGTPADILQGNEKHAIELLLEQFKHFNADVKFSQREKLIRCMSRQQAVKAGQHLSQQEMLSLIESLYMCNAPNITSTGSPTYLEFKENYLDKMFGR